MRDSLDLRRGIDHRVGRALILLPPIAELFSFLRLAKIKPPGQLAHNEDINATPVALAGQRTSMGELRQQLHWAQIGKQSKLLPQPQQRRSLGPLLFWNGRVAIREPHRTK